MAIHVEESLQDILEKDLKPLVKRIDQDAFYPESVIQKLPGLVSGRSLYEETRLIHEVSATCMTTGFNLWCHFAALTYIRHTENLALKVRFRHALEEGTVIGATGLSNPMKHYAGLEKLHLNAVREKGGYSITGALPAVSNLGPGHWFGIIAQAEEPNQRIMAFIPFDAKGLSTNEKLSYAGINGSATYSCKFNSVFVPDEEVITEDADQFVKTIRPYFVTYQIPLGTGVTEAAMASIGKYETRQNRCNDFLSTDDQELCHELTSVQEKLDELTSGGAPDWSEIIQLKKQTTELTASAVHTAMLHAGGSGYQSNSPDYRRLRESYFFLNLTPTIKHLEKLLKHP
ncbi:acyl-CoA dehydrogenase family protein [Salisediminibacterium beveridgei]|uniref:Acyl-CoA Dehydrogenase n=1 Tax=Salisediminibacterium beveridgei TaxID=632773 RepID=A0A1D7QT37_9BACI|nr:acyl-CoA/acyl-ACP dehydrogenase [Salisediminibacterium beveridgei]AOM82165.1 Acyl-CoA Dehydrogenase [Salisediminibacterium beveridgei]